MLVERAIDDGMGLLVLVRQRLIAGRDIDDGQPRMTEANVLSRRNPCVECVDLDGRALSSL